MSKLHFLVIQLRQIGDVLISTTLCETLKRNFPNAQVDYAVYDYTAAVAENNPFIDNLLVFPHGFSWRSFGKWRKIITFMRKQHYDYAVDILNTPKSVYLAKVAKAKTIIGPQNQKRRSKNYDIQVPFDEHFLTKDEVCISVKNRLCLLKPINNEFHYITQYKLHLTSKEINSAKRLLDKLNIDHNKPIFFFSPGSRSPQQKQWLLDNFITVIETCIKKHDAQIILYPGPNQLQDCLTIRNKISKPENILIIENYNLREMAAIIKLCTLFVGNDSGASHIAIAVGTPSITIFSPAIWHHDWHFATHPQHLAITAQTLLGVNDTDYEKLLLEQTTEQTQKLYQLIEPNIVETKIQQFMNNGYFA